MCLNSSLISVRTRIRLIDQRALPEPHDPVRVPGPLQRARNAFPTARPTLLPVEGGPLQHRRG